MDGIHRRFTQRKLSQRRFLHPIYTLFTQRADGTTWSKANNTLRTAPRYLEGVLLPGRRKTMRSIARRVNVPEDRIQRFITESPWTHESVQIHLNKHLPPEIASPKACLLVDEVGLLKQGHKSVGVQKQYSGAAGRVENSQVAVDLVLATPGESGSSHHTWPLGFQLFIPEAWVQDASRREETGVPDEIEFQTKPQIATNLLQRAFDNKVPHACVGGDAIYGNSPDFRGFLRERNEPYILGITGTTHQFILDDPEIDEGDEIPADMFRGTARELAKNHQDWKTITYGIGAKGPLTAEFARWRVRVIKWAGKASFATDEVAWLIVERAEKEFRAYLAWGVDSWSLEKQVEYAHIRWTIEKFHRDAKQDLALDSFEGRSWKGWNHHMTMVMLAFAFLSTIRAEQSGDADPAKFGEILHAIYVEEALRILVADSGMSRKQAKPVAEQLVRRLTDY